MASDLSSRRIFTCLSATAGPNLIARDAGSDKQARAPQLARKMPLPRPGMEQSPLSPFFINERKQRCAGRTVNGTFRMLTRHLGLVSVYGRGTTAARHLAAQRGLSSNTILAYRDALKLFLSFLAASSGKSAARLRLEDLKADSFLAFLEEVEQKRKNCTSTRNLRLAALRTSFQYMIAEDTIRSGQYQRIVAIPLKRSPLPVMGYLDIGEVQTVLDSINRNTSAGSRDYALFVSVW